ncbi:MAG: hypothetical protein LBN96_07875 [Desulfovibrio sp.]|jgi:hypothetical protein|nr:hypothetical protein [Desulfovibrio sp.]
MANMSRNRNDSFTVPAQWRRMVREQGYCMGTGFWAIPVNIACGTEAVSAG